MILTLHPVDPGHQRGHTIEDVCDWEIAEGGFLIVTTYDDEADMWVTQVFNMEYYVRFEVVDDLYEDEDGEPLWAGGDEITDADYPRIVHTTSE